MGQPGIFVQSDLSNNESYYKYRLISQKNLQKGNNQFVQKRSDLYAVSRLNFTVSMKHLRGGRVRLKCSASVLDLYWKSVQVKPKVLDRNHWLQGKFTGSKDRISVTCC